MAPFVKVDALRRIITRVPRNASVKIVARWIPGEIFAGVCDLEIYDLVIARPNTELYVHPLLHAKSYRFDEFVYIGSANLSSKAMGWVHPSNIEILEPAGERSGKVRELERRLLATSIKVDESYRSEMARLVELLGGQTSIDESFFEAHISVNPTSWLPSCRDPMRVWLVYSDPHNAQKRTVESALEAAKKDLSALAIPVGRSIEEFREIVTIELESLPLVTEITHEALLGLSEADAIKLVTKYLEPRVGECDPASQWEILREWLLEFFPNVYRREVYPDLFRVSRIVL